MDMDGRRPGVGELRLRRVSEVDLAVDVSSPVSKKILGECVPGLAFPCQTVYVGTVPI